MLLCCLKTNPSFMSFERQHATYKNNLNILLLGSLKCILWSCTGLTEGSSNAIAFAVDEPSHLCQVTVPFSDVIDSRRLHNEGIVRL